MYKIKLLKITVSSEYYVKKKKKILTSVNTFTVVIFYFIFVYCMSIIENNVLFR